MFLPKPEGGDFTPPPAGTHIATCYRVVDLGTQLVEFNGETKKQRKVMLSWELPDELMDDGRPFTINKRYTYSGHEKAQLRKDLESWRGAPFQDADFGPGGFDIRKVIGVPCLLSIVHETNKMGKLFANITAVVKPPKGTARPALVNTPTTFSLDEFDPHTFHDFPDWLKTVIMKSPEYADATRAIHNSAPPTADDDGRVLAGEEVPF